MDSHDDATESAQTTEVEARAEANVAAAWAAFETFRDELNTLLCEVRAGETARAKKLTPTVSELARAVSRVADECNKLSGAAAARGGHHADVSLDLTAARAEVRRRLDQLRIAREPGGSA